MDYLRVLHLGVVLCVYVVSAFTDVELPKAENVHWVSVDFKTVLHWTAPPSDHTYTVQVAQGEDGDWETVSDCLQIQDSECDVTSHLFHKDRTYTADVQTETGDNTGDHDFEELPHTTSPPFNPYRQSELSAVTFSIQKVAERSVTLNISDPLTSLHKAGKQLTIRDVLKKDLKYKVSYYKSRSTGKRDLVVDSNQAQILNLDPGQSYCFMVCAFVPSRTTKALQQGEWSTQTCTPGGTVLDELNLNLIFKAIFIPLVLIIIIVTVILIYCRYCRHGNKTQTQAKTHTETQTKTTVV